MAAIKWEYTLTFIFAICSVILLLLIGMQTHYGENTHAQLLQEIENVESAGFTLQDIPGSPIADETQDEYSELVERPLFFDQRRPIIMSEDDTADEQEKEPQVFDKITIKLISIIITPDSKYAFFHDRKGKSYIEKFLRFKLGDDISGRTIKEIKPDRVIISSVTGSEEILLTKPRVHKATRRRKAPTPAKTPKRTNPFNRKTTK